MKIDQEKGGIKFNYPKFVKHKNATIQASKVVEEAAEFEQAYFDPKEGEDELHWLDELHDCKHAIETFMRYHATEEEIEVSKSRVIFKNIIRRYYDINLIETTQMLAISGYYGYLIPKAMSISKKIGKKMENLLTQVKDMVI